MLAFFVGGGDSLITLITLISLVTTKIYKKKRPVILITPITLITRITFNGGLMDYIA